MKPIIGFGTGRSGTVSLAKWLGLTHEFNADLAYQDLDRWLAAVTNKASGDVSYWNIKFLDHWLEQDVIRIALMRDADATVHSLCGNSRGFWEAHFKQFDFDSKDDCYRYWDWYYNLILKHQDKFIIISPELIPIKANQAKDSTYYQAKNAI